MTTRTEQWVEDTAGQLLSWLHPGHLLDEEQARILRAVMRAYAHTSLPGYNRTLAMRDAHDPDRVPGQLLPHLGALFGLDAAVGFPRHFTEAQWRRFIPRAIEIWRQAGFDLRDICVSLLARPVLVADWHLRKDILGETGLPYFGLTAPGASPWSEYTVDLHLPDPYGIYEDAGGTLTAGQKRANRDLVHGALSSLRPWNERLDVYWYALVDDFSQGPFQWSVLPTSAADAVFDSLVSRSLTLPDGAGVAMAVGQVTDLWRRVVWTLLLTFAAAGDYWFRLRHDVAGETATTVRFTVDAATPAASTVRVYDEPDGSTQTLLGSVTAELHTGLAYHLQFTSLGGAASDGVRVVLDGSEILALAGTTSHGRTGTCSIAVDGGELTLQYTDVCMHPVPYHRVGPS